MYICIYIYIYIYVYAYTYNCSDHRRSRSSAARTGTLSLGRESELLSNRVLTGAIYIYIYIYICLFIYMIYTYIIYMCIHVYIYIYIYICCLDVLSQGIGHPPEARAQTRRHRLALRSGLHRARCLHSEIPSSYLPYSTLPANSVK